VASQRKSSALNDTLLTHMHILVLWWLYKEGQDVA
jgi:hypothetical protein